MGEQELMSMAELSLPQGILLKVYILLVMQWPASTGSVYAGAGGTLGPAL